MQITLPELKTGEINAVNAQNGEFVGEISCDARTGHTVNIFTGDKPYPNIGTKIYTAPQTMPPEWAEYVGRLEKSLEDLMSYQNGCPLPSYEKGWNEAMRLSYQVLASKPKG